MNVLFKEVYAWPTNTGKKSNTRDMRAVTKATVRGVAPPSKQLKPERLATPGAGRRCWNGDAHVLLGEHRWVKPVSVTV